MVWMDIVVIMAVFSLYSSSSGVGRKKLVWSRKRNSIPVVMLVGYVRFICTVDP